MPYKDRDKQRAAVKQATRRYRAKNGDSAISGQKHISKNARGLSRLADIGDTHPVIPSNVIPVIPDDVIPAVIPTCDEIVDVLHARIVANPKVNLKPEPQSYNPMMVGYVPPQG